MTSRVTIALPFIICVPQIVGAQLTAADFREATRLIDGNSANRIINHDEAVTELTKKREVNRFQRVELDGIIATDPTPSRLAKFFDGPHLQPAHNSADKLPPETSNNSKSWWERAFEWVANESHHQENNARDIRDLLDDKTGHLTERGLETLQPIRGENITVNEIVAHSWGAVLLHNAILEGAVKPPKRIIVVGVPDGDVRKWRMLADATGTDVVIVQNRNDHAVGTAGMMDDLNDMDINGGEKRFNDGRIADRWRAWKRNHPDLSVPRRGDLKSWTVDLPKEGNRTGHARFHYFDALIAERVIDKTADEMLQDENRRVDQRAAELREQQIRGMADAIRQSRQIQEDIAKNNRRAAPPERLPQALPVIDRYWQARALSSLSRKVCVDPSSLTQDDMISIGISALTTELIGAKEFSDSLNGCAKWVFDTAVSHFGRRDGITREMFAYWAQQYHQQQTPQPTPSFDDGDGRGRGETDSNDDCVTPPGSPRACPGIRR